MASSHEDPSLFWYCGGFVCNSRDVSDPRTVIRDSSERWRCFCRRFFGVWTWPPYVGECKLLFFHTFKLNTFIDPSRLPLLQKHPLGSVSPRLKPILTIVNTLLMGGMFQGSIRVTTFPLMVLQRVVPLLLRCWVAKSQCKMGSYWKGKFLMH